MPTAAATIAVDVVLPPSSPPPQLDAGALGDRRSGGAGGKPEGGDVPGAGEGATAVAAASPPPWYASLPDPSRHEGFFREALEVLVQHAVFEGTARDAPVLQWRAPQQLEQLLDLRPADAPEDHPKLIQRIRDVIQYSVKTGHPYFVNQLFSSVDPYGLVGQWLGDALNPSVYTYEVSPVFTLMEEAVLKEMRRIAGFPDGRGDGIFCPGGSIANGYAISCARFHAAPQVKDKGLHDLPRMVLFTSEDAHYSIKKLSSYMGLGSDNVYLVKCDGTGKMDVSHLEQLVLQAQEEGALPFMVSATAGTTVLGAYDPLPAIADICKKYNMWMHVDAAWGGGALMSQKYKHLLEGIEKSPQEAFREHLLTSSAVLRLIVIEGQPRSVLTQLKM